MKYPLSVCAAVLLIYALSGCKPAAPPDTRAADVKAIASVEAAANQAWAAKDADGIAAFYTDDAVLIVSGSDELKGKTAVVDAINHMLTDPALSLSFHADQIQVARSGDVGYSEGPYQLTLTDPVSHKVVHDHGNYLTTFRKQANGSWKASVDVAVSAIPPVQPKHQAKGHAAKAPRHRARRAR